MSPTARVEPSLRPSRAVALISCIRCGRCFPRSGANNFVIDILLSLLSLLYYYIILDDISNMYYYYFKYDHNGYVYIIYFHALITVVSSSL